MMNWIQHYIPTWVFLAFIIHGVVLGSVAYMILLERKVASWAQDRLGPNRVGPFGLLQPLADGLKFILKEDYMPKGVDKWLFSLAPALMIAVVIVSIAVVPWGGVRQGTMAISVPEQAEGSGVTAVDAAHVAATDAIPWGTTVHSVTASTITPGQFDVTYRYDFQIASLDIGVLFIIALLSLAVYGVVLGGWASNNKYSFLGGLRATANMISYEIPMGLSILTIVVMFGSLDLGVIVQNQAHYWLGFIPAWNVFTQPVAFFMFLVCIHAEANRAPFDVAEAEQELVGGYHTEYSSMRFALFFLGEYAGMITSSAVMVALFFGGWHFPGLTDGTDASNPAVTGSLTLCIIRSAVFFAKIVAVMFVFMWTRWSLPRFRFDQVMMLAWRAMIPISLLLLLVTAVVLYLFGRHRTNMMIDGPMAAILLAANVLSVVVVLLVSRVLPPPPATNRKIALPNSRYLHTPVPASNGAAS